MWQHITDHPVWSVLLALVILAFLFAIWTLLRSASKSGPPDVTAPVASPSSRSAPASPTSTRPPGRSTQEVTMPRSTSKYAERESLASAVSSLSAATQESVLAAYDAANPSAFTDESSLSDAQFRAKAVEFTRRHLRRFPKTDCALALSIKGLATGTSSSYQR